jgi:copper homeostasis protein
MPKLEIAVTSLDDLENAVAGGADSVELSYDLSVGGLTPSMALAVTAPRRVDIPVHIIIRPHARDFIYTEAEIEQILHDAKFYADLGAASIVFGAVTPDNHLNIPLIQQVAAQIAPTPLTVHRALDTSADPDSAVASLAGMIPRILTSGPASNAWDGREATRRWVEKYGDRVEFVLSGSIQMEQLAELAAYTRAPVYHLGGAARTNGVVDVEKVRKLRAILNGK